MGYSLIYADPPWEYGNTISNGAAENHYGTMKLIDIKRLPVWELAAEDSVLAMWFTGTHTREAIELAEAWGFKVRTMKGFTWHKTNKHKGNSAIGMGHMTRGNSEDMLFAVKGKMLKRMNAGICQLQIFPRMEHSAKPPEFRDLLVQLVGDKAAVRQMLVSHLR